MKNAYFLVLSGALFAYNAAHAQVVTTPVEPPSVAQVPQEQPPVAAQPPAATSQPQAAASTSPATESRRDEVRAMEVFLMGALQKGAQDLARQLRVNEPNSAFVTGTGRARGFLLEGYGMFFDVDVPGMKQSVIWSAQMLQLEQDRQSYARFLATAAPDDPRRKFVEERLRNVQVLMARRRDRCGGRGGPDRAAAARLVVCHADSAGTFVPRPGAARSERAVHGLGEERDHRRHAASQRVPQDPRQRMADRGGERQ
jgi:hypothetical protein